MMSFYFDLISCDLLAWVISTMRIDAIAICQPNYLRARINIDIQIFHIISIQILNQIGRLINLKCDCSASTCSWHVFSCLHRDGNDSFPIEYNNIQIAANAVIVSSNSNILVSYDFCVQYLHLTELYTYHPTKPFLWMTPNNFIEISVQLLCDMLIMMCWSPIPCGWLTLHMIM